MTGQGNYKIGILAAALSWVLLSGASCSPLAEPDRAQREPVPFSVLLPESGEDAPATKSAGDGSAATQLLVGVFDAAGHPLFCQTVTRTGAGEPFTFTLPLVRELNYQVAFWAQGEDAWVASSGFTAASLTNIPLTGHATLSAETDDAFSGRMNVAAGESTVAVTLERVWAQVNVATTATSLDLSTAGVTSVELTLTGLPTNYNVLTDSFSGSGDRTFSGTVEGGTFTVGGTSYTLLGHAYAPAAASPATAHATVMLKDALGATVRSTAVSNLPLRRGYRTNILGNL
ncbi:MAG: hypothetical protein IJV64_08655 [Oscillospiraceae bacterium]|nr:hypothetical protein [Oscillospiraceae bacterium]